MNDTKSLSDAFKRLIKALKNCDENELNNLILEDYIGFSLNGTIETKNDIIEHFSPGGISITEYTVENSEYIVYDTIGIITGRGIIAGNYEGFTFRHQVLFTDIFRFADKHWKYFKSQVTEIKTV